MIKSMEVCTCCYEGEGKKPSLLMNIKKESAAHPQKSVLHDEDWVKASAAFASASFDRPANFMRNALGAEAARHAPPAPAALGRLEVILRCGLRVPAAHPAAWRSAESEYTMRPQVTESAAECECCHMC